MIEFHFLHWEILVFFLMHSKSHYKSVKFSFWVSVVCKRVRKRVNIREIDRESRERTDKLRESDGESEREWTDK